LSAAHHSLACSSMAWELCAGETEALRAGTALWVLPHGCHGAFTGTVSALWRKRPCAR